MKSILILIAIGSICSAQMNKLDECLIDDFVLRAVERSTTFSVLCSQRDVKVDKFASGETYSSSSNRIFRIVRCGDPVGTRLDIRSTRDDQSIYEHSLVLRESRMIAFGLEPGQFLSLKSLPPGATLKPSNRFYLVDFPAIALLNLTCLQGGRNFHITNMGAAKCFDSKTLKNGNKVFHIGFPAGQTYEKLTFGEFEGESLPMEAEWFESPDPPININQFSPGAVKNWRSNLFTSTKWKKHESYGYLPEKVHMRRQIDADIVEEAELHFLQWTFGENVDAELLKPEKFTRENILKFVNFDAWANEFVGDKLKNK